MQTNSPRPDCFEWSDVETMARQARVSLKNETLHQVIDYFAIGPKSIASDEICAGFVAWLRRATREFPDCLVHDASTIYFSSKRSVVAMSVGMKAVHPYITIFNKAIQESLADSYECFRSGGRASDCLFEGLVIALDFKSGIANSANLNEALLQKYGVVSYASSNEFSATFEGDRTGIERLMNDIHDVYEQVRLAVLNQQLRVASCDTTAVP